MGAHKTNKKTLPRKDGFSSPVFAFIAALVFLTGILLARSNKHPAPAQKNERISSFADALQKPIAQEPVAPSSTIAQEPSRQATTTASGTTEKSPATTIKPAVVKKQTEKPVAPTEEKKQTAVKAGIPLPVQTTTPPPEKSVPAPHLQSEKDLNETIRKTVVNVYCTTKTSGAFNPATGSGVLIHPSGVILTNAHVAQYYLLKDYHQKDFITCFIRTGSPARITYRAEPLYISQRWIAANPDINKQDDAPTGNSDFALLRVTERVDSGLALPDAFPYLPLELDDSDVRVGDSAVVVSYPAGFLEGLSIQNNLFLSSAVVTIKKLFGFSDNAFDVFSIGGSVVAQQGSSGGAVARQKSGKLTGIITLSTVGENTGMRDLRALTLSHINRAFKKETGIDLDDLLAKGDFPILAQQFKTEIAPTLTKTLMDTLKK